MQGSRVGDSQGEIIAAGIVAGYDCRVRTAGGIVNQTGKIIRVRLDRAQNVLATMRGGARWIRRSATVR